jgi:hypothetical protein
MADPFRLTVSSDSRFRGLVPEVASRYVEVLGGSAPDAEAVAQAVNQAISAVATEHPDAGPIELSCRVNGGTVEVELAHDGRAQTVTCPLALKS